MNKIARNSLWIILLLVFVGCTRGDDYKNAIPEQSAAVVSIDLSRLATRAGLDASNGETAVNRLKEFVKSGLDGSSDFVDRIFSDVSESGLDLKDNIYLFAGEEMSTVGLLAKVLDSSKLESLLELLHKQQLCQQSRETDGCHWTVLGKWLMAYSDDALLILIDNKWSDPSKLVRQASMWLRQKDGQGFAANPDFKQLQETSSDIVAWTSLQLFPRQVLAPITMGLSAEIDFKKIKTITAIDFEDGKVVMDVHPLITDPIIEKLMEQKMKTMGPVKGSYLDMFSPKIPFWTTVNLKGGDFYKFLREIPAVRKYFDYSDLPVTLDYGRIFEAIQGDVAVAITDSRLGDFIVYADVNQTEFLSVFTELRPMIAKTNGMLRLDVQGEDSYLFVARDGSVLNMRSGLKVFWLGVKNGHFYFTNNEELIDGHILGLTLRNLKWGKRVPNQHFFAMSTWNGLRTFEYLMQENNLSAVPKMLSAMMDYMTIESADGKSIHWEVIQKDASQNLIRQLLNQ